MNSEGTNGEYIVTDLVNVHIVTHFKVKLFMITEGVFLCVGDVLIEVLCGMELNDLLHCGTEGSTSRTGWTRSWRSLEMDRDGWISSCE